jgi:tocopherol cyclase
LLIGYRSEDIDLDFKPPFTLKISGLPPFISVEIDWENRSVPFNLQTFSLKLVVSAKAPAVSFFTLKLSVPRGILRKLPSSVFPSYLRHRDFPEAAD